MKNKNPSVKSSNSVHPSSLLNSNLSESASQVSKTSTQLLTFYRSKCLKLEEEYEYFTEVLNKVKSACDLSNELQQELTERNEEISKLQHIVGELQIHLCREKEKNLKLIAENDGLKIEDYENKKRIKTLLMVTGMCERKFYHFTTKTSQDKIMEVKLPEKLQKLKEAKQKEAMKESNVNLDEVDPQVLLLNNQLLASQLENHIKVTRDEINVLLQDKEVSEKEREIERQRLQNEIVFLTSKLKETQTLLCETTEKLIKVQRTLEKEKTKWMEEKDKFMQTIETLKDSQGVDVADILNICMNGAVNFKHRSRDGRESSKEGGAAEKESANEIYQEQILALETEVNRLRERAQICKNKFREKTEKMTALVTYLKNKYEDLDRRRLLEAQGFRTDIRMLKERVKELEKKLSKVSSGYQCSEQQQLLVSARNTLNRAKQLEKELMSMKSKISALESNEDSNL